MQMPWPPLRALEASRLPTQYDLSRDYEKFVCKNSVKTNMDVVIIPKVTLVMPLIGFACVTDIRMKRDTTIVITCNH